MTKEGSQKPASNSKPASGKKTAPAKARATKAKATAPTRKRGAVKAGASRRELIFRQFGTWTPETLYRQESVGRTPEAYQAPSDVSPENSGEAARIRQLLFKKFDPISPAIPPEETVKASAVNAPSAAPPPGSQAVRKDADPMAAVLKWALAGFALLVAVVIKVSADNRSTYAILPTASGVEIRQGLFAPMGQEKVLTLPGAAAPEPLKPAYDKQAVDRFAFDYFIQRADALLEKPGMPDFEEIKNLLQRAEPFAVGEKDRNVARARANAIDQMILLIKADVAAGKETLPDYEAALEYLRQAMALDGDGSKTELIKEKSKSIQSAIKRLEPTETPAAAASPAKP